jgi:hypothetical protein
MKATVMQQPYSTSDLREILGRLANVKSEDEAEEFLKEYGPLRERRQGDPRDRGHLPLKVAEVIEYARRFREAWESKTNPNFDYRQFNRMLDEIFTVGDPIAGERPWANFETGTWEPVPRDLLGTLAQRMMADRTALHRCEREECRRYFVKNFSRDRYCTFLRQFERELDRIASCGEVMRRRGQELSAKNNRDKINRLRRKPKGKGRQ